MLNMLHQILKVNIIFYYIIKIIIFKFYVINIIIARYIILVIKSLLICFSFIIQYVLIVHLMRNDI